MEDVSGKNKRNLKSLPFSHTWGRARQKIAWRRAHLAQLSGMQGAEPGVGQKLIVLSDLAWRVGMYMDDWVCLAYCKGGSARGSKPPPQRRALRRERERDLGISMDPMLLFVDRFPKRRSPLSCIALPKLEHLFAARTTEISLVLLTAVFESRNLRGSISPPAVLTLTHDKNNTRLRVEPSAGLLAAVLALSHKNWEADIFVYTNCSFSLGPPPTLPFYVLIASPFISRTCHTQRISARYFLIGQPR